MEFVKYKLIFTQPHYLVKFEVEVVMTWAKYIPNNQTKI